MEYDTDFTIFEKRMKNLYICLFACVHRTSFYINHEQVLEKNNNKTTTRRIADAVQNRPYRLGAM